MKGANVPESDLLKAIGELEEAATLQKAETEPVPRGFMDSTKSARGGSATVLEGGPGSREDLVPEGHGDPSRFDMGSTQGPRAEMGKGDDDPDVNKADEDEDDYDKKKKGAKKKSMRKSFEERPTIKKAIEVSQFLEELTDSISDSVDGLRKAMLDGQQGQAGFNHRLAKAVVAIGNEVSDLQKSLTEIGNQPAAERKSVLSKSELVARDFEGNEDGENHQGGGGTRVGKDDVLDFLVSKAEKGEIPPESVTEYELTDRLSPNIAADVRQHFEASA